MKYFFTLGNNPALSLAELAAVYPDSGSLSLVGLDIAILETDQKIEAVKAMKNLGGTIKLGLLTDEVNFNDSRKILDQATSLLSPGNDKFNFGLSYYGPGRFNTKALGMEMKKYLREKNISCRLVTSRDKNLSSVVVEQNKLTKSGAEIVLIKAGSALLIGRTLAVQPFKELSFRDYGRPARDDQSGMLPPKLAQIMINLSGVKKNSTLLDPFCGSGTILTEAMLMGYSNLLGTDISDKAVNDTRQNIDWIADKFRISNFEFRIFTCQVDQLSKEIKTATVDAIITEPYLGPQRGQLDLAKVIPQLEKLYTKALPEFSKILKPKGRLVMLWPVFYNKHRINPKINGFKITNPLPPRLLTWPHLKLSPRNTIIYGRPGQKVWREIIIMENNN